MSLRITVVPSINSLDRPRYLVQADARGQNITLTLIVTAPSEFLDLINNASMILLFKGQFNITTDWNLIPESLRRNVQSLPCWRILYEKFIRNGLMEADGMTTRGAVTDQLPVEASPPSPKLIRKPDFFAEGGEKPTRIPSDEKKSPPSRPPAMHAPATRARVSQQELDKHVKDAAEHIRYYGGNPPMVSSTSKVLLKATNYIRDQMNLRHLDDTSLEAIVRKLEQLGVGA